MGTAPKIRSSLCGWDLVRGEEWVRENVKATANTIKKHCDCTSFKGALIE